MKCISLYSGADNLGDGVIQAGHDVFLAVEMNKDACETIKLNHPDTEVINGMVSEHLESLPRADCIIGGPPCPEFSRAKTNRTMDLCEVNNFRRAIEITKAEHHFMENVQDLYKVHKERNFLVNCADYGVPQTRIRRIFTDLPLPSPTHAKNPSNTLFGEPLKRWVSVREALNLQGGELYISNSGHNTQNREYITRSVDESADTITIASTMQLTDYTIKSRKKIKNREQSQEGYKRTLTNEELAILQGFRSDFKFYGGKTSVKKQIGNALPAPISKAFFTR
jgi:DNA (cytosine-5)-methyltransferase 1